MTIRRSENTKKLTGQRNQCPTCLEFFNTNSGFDKHRTGDHTHGKRRCLSVAEMEAKGMKLNAGGFWIQPVRESSRAALAKMRIAATT